MMMWTWTYADNYYIDKAVCVWERIPYQDICGFIHVKLHKSFKLF